jgi:hypothetical protein
MTKLMSKNFKTNNPMKSISLKTKLKDC